MHVWDSREHGRIAAEYAAQRKSKHVTDSGRRTPEKGVTMDDTHLHCIFSTQAVVQLPA